MKILIFSNTQTPRFQYITNEILHRLLGFELDFCTDEKTYIDRKTPKINYSEKPLLDSEIWIKPQGLLAEKNIQNQPFLEKQIAFSLENNSFSSDFDLFAAAFYLLSRYEEYLPFEADVHGRFMSKNALAKRLDFLQRPLVEEWANSLFEEICTRFSLEKKSKNRFSFTLTYDIDQAFSYKNKGFVRGIFILIKNVFNEKYWKVLLGKERDPFDNFEYLHLFHQEKKCDVKYFFLLANWGKYDKNISAQNVDFQNIIKKVSENYGVGIHPSYASNEDEKLLKLEINRLEKITEKKVKNSRQHFLKLSFPTTYQRLLAQQIEHDFSLAYADEIGFRASMSRSFFWYDLSVEKATLLLLHPFAVMDVTLKEYLKLSPEKALENIQKIVENTKKVNGNFTSLWHNSSFDEDWDGWKEIYEKMVERLNNQ
jgi:hypothetical protein